MVISLTTMLLALGIVVGMKRVVDTKLKKLQLKIDRQTVEINKLNEIIDKALLKIDCLSSESGTNKLILDKMTALFPAANNMHDDMIKNIRHKLNELKESNTSTIRRINAHIKDTETKMEITQHNILCMLNRNINRFRFHEDFDKYDPDSIYLIYKTCYHNLSNNINNKTIADYRTIDINNMEKYNMNIDRNIYTTIIAPSRIKPKQSSKIYITYNELSEFCNKC